MVSIISFRASGAFASFRDPSVTANQTVYYIPSKTAIVGMIGAMLGILRSNILDQLYEKPYLDLFSKINVGVKLENNPRKIVYFTNHRSLKAAKTKPVKKEILDSPQYQFFVQSTENILDQLNHAITNSKFVFTPYFGHVYCPAKICDFKKHNATLLQNVEGKKTDCVILDESDSNFNENFKIKVTPKDDSILIVERHLHHYMQDEKLSSRVFKHWIPIDSQECKITQLEHNTVSKFYQIDSKVYCLY